MEDINNKCREPLKSSPYARSKIEGYPAVKEKNNLVCRNYPKCEKAEKDFE
jgi:hypothetical protein